MVLTSSAPLLHLGQHVYSQNVEHSLCNPSIKKNTRPLPRTTLVGKKGMPTYLSTRATRRPTPGAGGHLVVQTYLPRTEPFLLHNVKLWVVVLPVYQNPMVPQNYGLL